MLLLLSPSIALAINIGGMEVPPDVFKPEALKVCKEKVLNFTAIKHYYGESRPCVVYEAEPVGFKVANEYTHIFVFKAKCTEPKREKPVDLSITCSAVKDSDVKWSAFIDKY